jgi:hypothetical protein
LSVGGIWPTIAPIAKGILSPEMSNIHLSGQPEPPLRAIPPLTALLAFERAATQLSFRRAARDLALIPDLIDQNPCAHRRNPMDMIFQGRSMSVFQA